MPGEQREDLGDADGARLAELERVEPAVAAPSVPGVVPATRLRTARAPAHPLAAQEHAAVRRRGSSAAASGSANTTRSACSESRPTSPAGIVATTSSQPRRASGVSRRRRAEGAGNAPDEPPPGGAVEDDQRERRRDVEADQEREEVRLLGRLGGDHAVPAEQSGAG